MKKLSIFLVWIAMIGGLIYWTSNIEGTVNAGQVDASTVVTRGYTSSSGNNSQYYTFAYADAKTGKIKYVENEYLDYQEEVMLKKGIYIKSNGGEIAGLVLCWIGFVAFSICYIIAICATFLYLGFAPVGMIISFILTEDFTNFFYLLVESEKYIILITDKLESIFLK